MSMKSLQTSKPAKATASKVEGNNGNSSKALSFGFNQQKRLERAEQVMVVYECKNPDCTGVARSFASQYESRHGKYRVGEPFYISASSKTLLNSIKLMKHCDECDMPVMVQLIPLEPRDDEEKSSSLEKVRDECEKFEKQHQGKKEAQESSKQQDGNDTKNKRFSLTGN